MLKYEHNIFAAKDCDRGKVKCDNGRQCIYKRDVCDRYTHCEDKSDENEDMCKGETSTVRFHFHLSKFRS